MKKFTLLFCSLLFFSTLTFGQTLYLNENFDYGASPNSDITAVTSNWARHSGTQGPQYISSSLSYVGYSSSGIGGALSFTKGSSGTNDGDVNRVLSTSISTTSNVYVSFLVNLSAANATGDYFFHLAPAVISTTFRGRVYVQTNGSGFQFGLVKFNETPVTYGSTVLSLNTTYLVVLKYSFNTTTTSDDEVTMYVYNSGIPSSEPGSPIVTIGPVGAGTTSDPSDIGSVAIREGSNTPTGTIDGIRVATSWSTLLPQSGLAAPVATAASNITANGFTANWNSVNTATDYWLDVSTSSNFSTFVTNYNAREVGNVTSFDVSSLDPNTTYYYRVHASNNTGAGPTSNTITVVTLVASSVSAPVATDATNISTTSFTANWNSSTGATKYFLDVSTTVDFSTFVTDYNNKDVGNVTSYSVTSLSTGITYYYRVRASNSNGTSANSNSITVITGQLAAPVALDATNITTTDFNATWSSSPSATTYILDVSTASDFSTFVTNYNAKDVGNVTSYKVTSVNSSTVYYYRVRASNSGGISANSNTISVTTLLAAPVATAATNVTNTSFTANWNISNGATNYWIDVSTDADFTNVLTSYNNKSVGNVTTFNIISLTTNTTYYFRVCASNNNGTSPYSNTITVGVGITGVDDLSTIPNRFDLFQNYPNPFNPSTTIKYQIPENTFVSIKVYNVLGCVISTLVNDMKSAGTYEVRFDASQLTSGIYIYKIQAGEFLQTKKMILIK